MLTEGGGGDDFHRKMALRGEVMEGEEGSKDGPENDIIAPQLQSSITKQHSQTHFQEF